ncbi:hypothetical protein H3N56_11295 [Cetobacterium sp. 2A]|uniref:hypothetical protein n=1 Tax=Cetobacterium sp. 2A TaxID=2754723 RepID=UPI00163BB153|nr:hypothetical protein [Cetobacterium sp. 2A]MBC2857017.1 hypothetical protein [Cetobacterium sp. 2A]
MKKIKKVEKIIVMKEAIKAKSCEFGSPISCVISLQKKTKHLRKGTKKISGKIWFLIQIMEIKK